MTLSFKILFKEFYHLLRDPNHREFLRLASRYGQKPRYQSQIVQFLQYRIQVADCFSFLWQFREIFAEEVYYFQSSANSPVIYDCGANVGVSCLYFKHIYPQAIIKAFEADPKVAALLAQNVASNGFKDVMIIDKAVWKENTTIAFTSEGADGGSVLTGTPSMQIPAIRLKDYLEAEQGIDLLKMDIEGAETDVLLDCRDSLGNVKHLFVEYHAYVGQPQRLGEMLTLMQQAGFRYFIKTEADRTRPFVNRVNKSTPHMDLQLNIFAYRS